MILTNELKVSMMVLMGLWIFPDQLLQFAQTPIDDIPQTKIALGERLFFDPILSSNRTVSCASCHKPEFAFADNLIFSVGVGNMPTTRNSPTAMYMSGRKAFFWDGRASRLEEQALIPIAESREMNLPIAEAIARLDQSPFYRKAFYLVFQDRPMPHLLGAALASYQRSLGKRSSAFDRYRAGDEKAMSTQAVRGLELFLGKARCGQCHAGTDFTDDAFRNIGLVDLQINEPFTLLPEEHGRFNVTKVKADVGKFKTPHLRNIALTAPYMHDGSIATLREVIRFYNDGSRKIHRHWNVDSLLLKPLNLTRREEKALEVFLQQLTDKELTTLRNSKK